MILLNLLRNYQSGYNLYPKKYNICIQIRYTVCIEYLKYFSTNFILFKSQRFLSYIREIVVIIAIPARNVIITIPTRTFLLARFSKNVQNFSLISTCISSSFPCITIASSFFSWLFEMCLDHHTILKKGDATTDLYIHFTNIIQDFRHINLRLIIPREIKSLRITVGNL